MMDSQNPNLQAIEVSDVAASKALFITLKTCLAEQLRLMPALETLDMWFAVFNLFVAMSQFIATKLDDEEAQDAFLSGVVYTSARALFGPESYEISVEITPTQATRPPEQPPSRC